MPECQWRKSLNYFFINLQLSLEKCFSSTGNNIDSSKNLVERSVYEGATFVPIAVPITWLNVFSNKIKSIFQHKFSSLCFKLFARS